MSKTYKDPRDGSTLSVEGVPMHSALKEPLLRFLGMEDSFGATVDLNRESVQALVEQAQQWLKDTEVKLPTTPGSVVKPKGDRLGVRAFLQSDGEWRGTSGLLIDPPLWVDGWEIVDVPEVDNR